ncbi:MAG TPA: hypothetical protein VFY10_15150 [Dehalococcoidia bacterium]|nr:hypothetical protein [Dehalococcoidia bacterium]
MESTADVNVTTIGTRVLVDAVWLQKANSPLQPLADGQLVLFHETSVLSRSSAGKLTGTTRIVVNPPRSLPLYFSGAAIGTFNIQSGGYVAINWATLSTTSNGLKMVDPHQYILLGPMGNLIDSSVDGLPTTISQ